MYNPEYYKSKKDELGKKFETAKNMFIQDIFNLLNRFGDNQQDLQNRIAEVNMEEMESMRKTEEENKKKIDEKVKKETAQVKI